MILVSVHSAKRSNVVDGWLELQIIVNDDGKEVLYPYSYRPDENEGLNPEITAWLMSNPDIPISVADPAPPPPPDPTPAEKLARAGLTVADLKALLA